MIVSPLTHSRNVTFIERIATVSLIKSWQKKFKIDIRQDFKDCKFIDVYRCDRTHLGFFIPSNLAGSSDLYEQLQAIEWYYIEDKWEYQMALKDLQTEERILEVGCGKGRFLERLKQAGKETIKGIELNPKAVLEGEKKGLPIVRENIYEFVSENRENFDAVCTFQVLEHIAEPDRFLKALLKLIKLKGKLIIAVPNCASFFIEKDSQNILNFPPHHVTHWYPETFTQLTELLPVQIERIAFEPLAEYHIDWYVSILLSQIPDRKLLRSFSFRFVHGLLKPLLKQSAILRQLIRGHTLYVCLQKIGNVK